MSITDSGGPRPPSSPLRKILPFTTVGVIVAALYVAWTFYSRHESNVEAQRQLEAKQDGARKKAVDQLFGNGEIRFPTFGASKGLLKRGESAMLCYGAVNVVSLKLDPAPPDETVKPTYHHCIEIVPKKTTTYTLTGANAKGETKSVSLEVRVQ